MKKAESLDITLPPEEYVEVLQEALQKMVEDKLKEDKDASK